MDDVSVFSSLLINPANTGVCLLSAGTNERVTKPV